MAILKLYKEHTGMTYIVEEGSILYEVLVSEGFSLVSEVERGENPSESPEGQEKHIEEEEEEFEGDKDISAMSKSELIALAELMGVSIAKKDNMATIVEKIKKAKGDE